MKKRFISLLLLSPLALSGCSFLTRISSRMFSSEDFSSERSSEKESSEKSSNNSSSSIATSEYSSSSSVINNSSFSEEIDYAEEIEITKIHFFDKNGTAHIYYNNSVNPFAYTGHKFSYVLINGVQPEGINYSEYLNSKGYFDARLSRNVETNYSILWYDQKDRCYLFGICANIIEYKEPEIVDPIDPDAIVYPNGYKSLIFQEEFDGTAVDETKWDYDIGNGSNGWGNGESQYYTKKNATVSDGKLHISAIKENYSSYNYTSSRMVTRGKFSFTYGYIEAKISLPEIQGMWPAFWMMPEDSLYGGWPRSGEIDIMEAKGRFPNYSSSALHFTKEDGNHTYITHENKIPNNGSLNGYHLYACEWTETSISFFVDGELHLIIYNNQWQTNTALDNQYAPFDQNFHLILNLAIGGHFDGYVLPPNDFSQCDMLVDYVRVFVK